MRRFTLLAVAVAMLLTGCRQAPAPAAKQAAESETLSVTRWSDKTELFMEYEPLVKGATRRFAIHFTKLGDFKAVSAGAAAVTLTRDGSAETFTAEAPSRPGIFGVDVTPAREGRYQLSVSLDAPGMKDTHAIGPVDVYASSGQVPPAGKSTEEHISFLKEQQWTLEFATTLAEEHTMRESLTVSGEVRPRSGGEAEVTAPVAGRIAGSPALPAIGTVVAAGRVLAAVVPHAPDPSERPALELAVAEARTALQLAERDRGRAERLVAAGAAPTKRLEEATAAQASARARVTAAQERLQQFESSRTSQGLSTQASAFAVRAPISGVVAAVTAVPGANVGQGDRLFRIVAADLVYVAAHVPEAELPRLRSLTGAEIESGGLVIAVRRLIARSNVIDPESRTLSVVYEVSNRGQLAVGQSVTVRLFLSGQVKAVAVPEAAVVDDAGRPVVFVQKEGEAFVRRPVTLGIRESGMVQIADGLKAGERVVTKGAYLIRLAALSSQIPAHGHVH